MPSARALIWGLMAFLAMGALAFLAVADALIRPAFLRWFAERRRKRDLGMVFDPVRPAPKRPRTECPAHLKSGFIPRQFL